MSDARDVSGIKKAVAEAAKSGRAFSACTPGISNSFTYSSHASFSPKSEYTRDNYYNIRQTERVPKSFIDSLMFCNESYYNVSIVRNIVDLMSDFCKKGLDWNHKNRNVQAFMRSWYSKIGGNHVSERFCNYLIRLGNLCMVPEMSRISTDVASEWKKTRGSEFKNIKVRDLTIPSGYNFIDVTALTEQLTSTRTMGNRSFQLNGNGGLVNSFGNYTVDYRKQSGQNFSSRLYQSLPIDIRKKITESNGSIILQEGKDVILYHYRKDDWDTWARPIILSIAEPLIMLQKMHLADASALDGVISNVRLWRVGYIDQTNILNSIIPEPHMLEQVANMIKTNVSGGVIDVVWGPELDFKESNSTAYEFLYPEKYTQVMSEIYDGFGVNPSLAGGLSSTGGSLGNSAISMKVLVERLAYIREQLTDFWMGESKKIQMAMGFSSPAVISFDDAIFSDEISYKKLLIELYDRDVISLEGLREEFNKIDPIESSRIYKEQKRRKSGKISPKASPYHDPMVREKLASDLVKSGNIDGEEFDIDVKKEDVFSKDKGGRPVGVKDGIKRDQKRITPKKAFASEFLEMNVWARESLEKISETIGSSYLCELNKKNFRQLTTQESEDFEDLKLSILCAIEPYSEINSELISSVAENIKNTSFERTIKSSIMSELSQKVNRPTTIEDERIASAAAYCISKMTEN